MLNTQDWTAATGWVAREDVREELEYALMADSDFSGRTIGLAEYNATIAERIAGFDAAVGLLAAVPAGGAFQATVEYLAPTEDFPQAQYSVNILVDDRTPAEVIAEEESAADEFAPEDLVLSDIRDALEDAGFPRATADWLEDLRAASEPYRPVGAAPEDDPSLAESLQAWAENDCA